MPCCLVEVSQNLRNTCIPYLHGTSFSTLLPWRWRQYVFPKRRWISTAVQNVRSLKIVILRVTIVRTSYLSYWSLKAESFSSFLRICINSALFLSLDSPSRPSPHCRSFEIIGRHATYGRTPLDEWSARRRDLYVSYKTHKKQTYMPTAGFETAVPASEMPQTHASGTSIVAVHSCNRVKAIYTVRG